jgi:hypothetical protein
MYTYLVHCNLLLVTARLLKVYPGQRTLSRGSGRLIDKEDACQITLQGRATHRMTD